MIDGGLNVNAKGDSDYNNTPLSRACANGYVGIVKLLLAAPGIDVNLGGYNNRSPLLMCAWEGHLECVDLLLHHPGIKPSLTAKGKGGNTPLLKAKTPEIRALLKAAIEESSVINEKVKAIRKKYKNPTNLLLKAVEAKDIESVRVLLNSGTENVNQCNNTSKVTPLIQAAWSKQDQMVELLLKQPTINVNAANKSLTTALHWACSKSDIGIVRLLLKHPKINVHLKTVSGRTAMYCCGSGNANIKQLLKQHGANVNEIQTRYGNKDELIKVQRQKCFRRKGTTAGFDVNLKGSVVVNNNNALTELVLPGTRVCKILLSRNIDVNLGGYKNRTPLIMCAWEGHVECVQLLLQRSDISQLQRTKRENHQCL